MVDEPFTLGPAAFCSCGVGLPLVTARLYDYFDGRTFQCDRCKSDVDWFEALSNTADFSFAAFYVVGAHSSHFTFSLKPGEVKELDFTPHMPEDDARILHVSYMSRSDGGPCVHAVELHGNSPNRRWFSKMPVLGHGAPSAPETTIAVSFEWILRSADDPSWESLVDAFEALHANEYNDMVVPANVAVEVRLGRFLTDLIRSRTKIGKEHIESFLSDGATYGHQLRVLLPLLCALLGVPQMPEKVRVGLNHLKDQRNKLGHTGLPKDGKPISREDAIRMAVAAALGCVYVEYLRERCGLGEA